MGSATSHGIQLTPVKTNTFHTPYHYHGRKINRFAHPHNRVLPPPVAGQRLRSTDNGSILQEKGTIRGQRAGGSPQPSDIDSEFLAVLQKRSDKLTNNHQLRSEKWQSISDPNISYSLKNSETNGKLKSKKKNRAPEPPSLSPSKKYSSCRRKKNGSRAKHPAPPPPIVVSIPSNVTKNLTQVRPITLPSREEETTESSDIQGESRHVVCDVRNNNISRKQPTQNIVVDDKRSRNEAFSEEIQQVTKRLAERMKSNQLHETKTSPKQYYFPDVEIERTSHNKANAKLNRNVKVDQTKEKDGNNKSRKPKTKSDQIDTEKLQKHNRITYRQIPESEYVDDSMESCSHSSESLASLNDSEDDIDLKLRPVLPRRQAELPKFSPTEAWKFLSAQHLDSIPSSEFGDDDEDRIWRLNRLAKRNAFERCEDSGISPDIESPVLTKEKHDGTKKHSQTVIIGQHSWIPQQDLLEDSDSNDLEDSIRNHRRVKVPVKLMLPNEMFNSKFKNLINKTVNHNDPDFKENHVKSRKVPGVRNTKPIGGFINLKKTMGTRNKNTQLDSNWVLNYQNNKMCKLTGTYNYVNSGGKKYLQSLIFGVKKNEEDKDKSDDHKNGIRKKFSFYSTEGHVIYLPEYETVELARKHMKKRDAENNRRKKTPDENITEVKMPEDNDWVFQMQKQYRRERVLEKNNIRDKLKLYRREISPLISQELPESRSQSCENIPERINYLGGWMSNPENLNVITPPKVFSSTSSSSPEIVHCNNRKQFTGASKWMRRQRQPPQDRNFSPTRPEPEGGDTSSDENGLQTSDDVIANCQNPITRQPSVYTELMEVAEQEEQRMKSKPPSNCGIQTESETKPKVEMNKEGTESSWKFKSGHQIQNQGCKNVPNKSIGQQNPPAKTFYMELEERMRQISKRMEENSEDGIDTESKISKKEETTAKHIFPNVIINEGGYKSVIQLSSVQPFNPNKGYRPVPFKVPSAEKNSTENK
ncbi:uncharacterized protein [Centruroides vittatus]|uniref:uncharacterized protein n=1 Tax=Centruroides vittatus TaxID=120091 RepID=UPI00350FA4A3